MSEEATLTYNSLSSMKERGLGNYIKSVAVRSLALDARANAIEMEPESSSLEVRMQACILWISTIGFPAMSRVTIPSEIKWSKEENNGYLNPFPILGAGMLDIAGWLTTLYINKNFPMTSILSERLGTNIGTHLGIDALEYGRQKLKKLNAPRREAFVKKTSERIRCAGGNAPARYPEVVDFQ